MLKGYVPPYSQKLVVLAKNAKNEGVNSGVLSDNEWILESF